MGITRRRFLAAGAVSAAGPAVSSVLPRSSFAPLEKALAAAAHEAIAVGASPGVAIQLTWRGKELLRQDVGLANLETATPVGPMTVFRVGSLSKQFTAALILRLVSQGKMQLEDPIGKHLSFFSGKPALTVRELLHHTAGLHSDDTAMSCPASERGPTAQVALASAITAQAKLFDFLPGTAWLYSNANYIVLGAIIEQLTGMSLSAAADVMLFKPLGLANTAFDSAAAVVRGRASGYTPVEGDTGRYTHAAFLEIDEAGGAGAMRSTTADLCQWSAALHGNQLFDARYVEEMRSPGRLRDGRLSAQRRFSANDAGYGDTSYAMGLLISGPSAPVPSLMHYGAINGYAAFLEYFPVHDLTVAVLCNGDMAPAMPFREIRKAIRSNIEQFRIV